MFYIRDNTILNLFNIVVDIISYVRMKTMSEFWVNLFNPRMPLSSWRDTTIVEPVMNPSIVGWERRSMMKPNLLHTISSINGKSD